MPCIPMQIKPNKSLSRQGTGSALSFTERCGVILFPPQDSVVRVKLSHFIHNAADTAGWCPHHTHIFGETERVAGETAER